MIGIGVGIDYSLFIVTRFRQLLHGELSPKDAAAEAGPRPAVPCFRRPYRRHLRDGLAFFGLDFVTKLGIGSALGVLTTVLIANSPSSPCSRSSVTRSTQLKVPFCQIDDSEAARQKTLIARWGRFVTAHAKPVFVILLLAGLAPASTSRSCASARRTRGRSRRSRRPGGIRPARRGLRPSFNAPIPIVVDLNGDDQGGARIYERERGWRAWHPLTSRSTTTRRRSGSSS